MVAKSNYRRLKNIVLRQHDTSDCGPACLLMALRYWGGDDVINHIRHLSGTRQNGTTMLGLCGAAKCIGLNPEGVEFDDVNELRDVSVPIVLPIVKDGKFEHYIICFGTIDDDFLIADPATKLERYSASQIEKVWLRKGLLLSATEHLLHKDVHSEKRHWLMSLVKDDIAVLTACMVIGIIMAMLGMTMPIFSQKLIDEVLPSNNVRMLIISIIALLILQLASSWIGAVRSKLLMYQARGFNKRIISFFLKKLFSSSKSFFDSLKIGDIVARLNDTHRLQSVLASMLGNIVINVLIMLVSMCYLFYISTFIASLTLVGIPIFFVIIYINNKNIIRLQRNVLKSYADVESTFINSFSIIDAIISYGRQSFFVHKNISLYSDYQEENVRFERAKINIGFNANIASVLIVVMVIGVSAFMVIDSQMSIGQFTAVMSVTSSILSAVASIALSAIPINEGKVAFERMYELIGVGATSDSEQAKCFVRNSEVEVLSVRHLSFRYAGHSLLLKDVSFEAKRGDILCIMGECGCGKSTLLQLIMHFYDIESGEITINNQLQNSMSNSVWQRYFAYASQESHIIDGTVAENVSFGCDECVDIEQFIVNYGFDKLLTDALPHGVRTIVGKDGINLSGGQRQLIAIARAIYANRPILLLDEITSAMDAETELHIANLLNRIKREHIIVVVTHNVSFVQKIADNISVINQGRICIL